MIFVQGAGPGVRGEFTTQAEWLAKAGVVTLVYDKRTVGYDFRQRDFGLLADDALRMLAELRKRPDVDPARTGLWGISEGSWVVPIAASLSDDVSFTVLVSAPNVSPMRQVSWALGEQLDRLHAPGGVRELLIRAMGAVDMEFLRHDAEPALRRTHQPVLALYGTRDPSIPFVESTRALTRALTAGATRTTRSATSAGPTTACACTAGRSSRDTWRRWPTGSRACPARPALGAHRGRHAGPALRGQRRPRHPVVRRGRGPGAHALPGRRRVRGRPVAAMVVRLRGRHLPAEANARLWPPIRRRFRQMAWTALGLLASVMAFIVLLVLFSVNQAGAWPAVLAGWLVIRALAVLILLQEVTAVAAVVSALREGWRPSRPQHVAIAGALGGTGLLLVAAAYYSLFALPW
nr:hypothetical protein GCM10020093_037120 [Planobispora longispora]